MDDLTSRPWWRWTTGMVVRVEGWGGRPVPQGVVVGSGEMARVADEWGTTPRIAELVAMAGVRVVPDLDSPAAVGCLLERLREAARERTVTIELPEETGDGAMVYFVGRPGEVWYGHRETPLISTAAALIRALDGVTGVAP